jgi:hypothetical protein
MSTSLEPLPSTYRSKQEFLASLPPWRRLLQKLNWHPTVELKVQRYELEQRLLQMRKEDALIESDIARLKQENARLAQINSRLERFEREHLSGSNPRPSTDDFSS